MAKYTMKPGDRIMPAGAYWDDEQRAWVQRKQHLWCANGKRIPMGEFVSADRAAARKKPKKKAAKRGNKAHKAAK